MSDWAEGRLRGIGEAARGACAHCRHGIAMESRPAVPRGSGRTVWEHLADGMAYPCMLSEFWSASGVNPADCGLEVL